MKTCTKCKEEKPFSEFHKNRSQKDGLSYYCKACKYEANKSSREKNKDHIREYNHKHYQENKDHYIDYNRKFRQENKDYYREYNRKYRKNQSSGVYKITNTINGKIYVGESVSCPTRFYNHKSRLKKGKHNNPGLQTDYDQHSLDIFDFQVIEEHPPDADKNLLLEREAYFINKYKEEGKELYNVD